MPDDFVAQCEASMKCEMCGVAGKSHYDPARDKFLCPSDRDVSDILDRQVKKADPQD